MVLIKEKVKKLVELKSLISRELDIIFTFLNANNLNALHVIANLIFLRTHVCGVVCVIKLTR